MNSLRKNFFFFQKIISSEDLDCEQREILNQLDSEADNNLTSELSEVIEIDHETLQRIHDLEVNVLSLIFS